MPAKNQFKRTKEELLAELRRVARKVRRGSDAEEPRLAGSFPFTSSLLGHSFRGYANRKYKNGQGPPGKGLTPGDVLTVTIREFKQHSKFAVSCYKRRFGTWNRALAEAGLQTGLVTRRNPTDPAEALCRLATHQPRHKATGSKQGKTTKGKKGAEGPCRLATHQPNQGQRARGKGKKKAAGKPCRLGRPLNFRGILYEPQSEHAVIHLFGTVSEEMGYRIEKIQHAYPDCIALRKVPGGRGAWERVRVEFELRSSHFRLHKHDPAYCDVIICWEHNWEACPLEVVELKRVVEALAAEKNQQGLESDWNGEEPRMKPQMATDFLLTTDF